MSRLNSELQGIIDELLDVLYSMAKIAYGEGVGKRGKKVNKSMLKKKIKEGKELMEQIENLLI
jgi:hypothetical protein